jgi:uncharacterized protein
MRLNVAQLLKEPIGSSRTYDVDGEPNGGSEEDIRSLRGQVALMRTDKGILLTATLDAEIVLACARCLNQFEYRMTLNIKEEYFATVDINSGLRLPPSDEPDAFTIDALHNIDLNEAVRQYFLMALPLKPLCRENCTGLCPSCGKNLNESPCDCEKDSADYVRLSPSPKRKGGR